MFCIRNTTEISMSHIFIQHHLKVLRTPIYVLNVILLTWGALQVCTCHRERIYTEVGSIGLPVQQSSLAGGHGASSDQTTDFNSMKHWSIGSILFANVGLPRSEPHFCGGGGWRSSIALDSSCCGFWLLCASVAIGCWRSWRRIITKIGWWSWCLQKIWWQIWNMQTWVVMLIWL